MESPKPGLCGLCLNCKKVGSARGTVFHLCLLHDRDPRRFVKYPRLPVLTCPVFEPEPAPEAR